VRKCKSRQLLSVTVSCRHIIAPKSSTWQTCLSCGLASNWPTEALEDGEVGINCMKLIAKYTIFCNSENFVAC